MPRNTFSRFTGLFLAAVVVLSCNKPDTVELPNEGTVYMPQAVGNKAKIDLQLSTKPQEVVFGAAYGGLHFAKQENNVSFKIDADLITSYNAANGTSYTLLPASAYTISGLNSVIPVGSTNSVPLSFQISTSTLPFGVRYMLPITLVSANGKVDPLLQTSYFRFDTITRKSVDITDLGTLTVSNEYPDGPDAGEGSLKLVDGEINTKYLYFGFNPDGWFQLQFPTPQTVGAYTFTSGDDAPGRDPKTWTLDGSNDGVNWTTVDTRTDELFSGRKQTVRYEVPGVPQAFSYYRVKLTANNGDGLFQMAEWRLIRYE
ncbi:MAG: DUF1735 domain-containing protein [Chitinophagaceae bacterium]